MATDTGFKGGAPGLIPQQIGGKLFLLAGIAAVIAVMVVFWLWSQQPDYRVLFSNFSDKDGGAIVAALDKMNISYKLSDSGTAILVPASQVHQARLKLASEGLPKGGNIGFELLEKQKFGVSRFVEQVNFQRGLEGELERSIQAIDTVASAIIHLAIPKQSVFVRDQQKPTASVLLNVLPGRNLDGNQVSAIVHLVASSVPHLLATNVTVVDQNGNLLSDKSKKSGAKQLDPAQLKYIDELQQSIARRVESIILPIVGPGNVRAEASAEIDFTSTEQAAEIYKPNQNTAEVAVRSMQSNESSTTEGNGASGVPGALSNQPQEDAIAPITAEEGEATTAIASTAPLKSQKNVTTNFEVDKTIRYVQQPMGGIKRINVAVVVNNMPVVDAEGKTTYRPLTAAEKQKINDLAMQAMGFNKERGDALVVVNSAFAQAAVEPLPEIPIWQKPATIEYAKDALRFLFGIIAMLLLYKKILKPMFNKLTEPLALVSNSGQAISSLNSGNGEAVMENNPELVSSYNQSLDAAKQIAVDNPRMVASVVSEWTSGTAK